MLNLRSFAALRMTWTEVSLLPAPCYPLPGPAAENETRPHRVLSPVNILGAPTNLGNRPYESDGTARLTTEAPARLREAGIVTRLGGRDLGDVVAPPYRDFVRPRGRIRNEDLVLEHVRAVGAALRPVEGFTLVLAGDCSVLPGCLLGLSRGREIGLLYIDAHDDFGTLQTSTTGSAAGMDLAFVTGHGSSELARLGGDAPLVRAENVVAVGVRDGDFGGADIARARTSDEVRQHLGNRPFFIHLDVDVLDPEVMPFVDSPEPGGMSADELVSVLRPLVRSQRAIGMELAIYDPRDDRDGRGAALLVDVLERAFRA